MIQKYTNFIRKMDIRLLVNVFFYWYYLCMNYVYKNNNPMKKRTGDCVIQALCNALHKSWEEVFIGLAEVGLLIYETIESNATWDIYIRNHGFSRHAIPDTCPDCYTVFDFCRQHPEGVYVLGTGNHAISVIDGVVYDTWNSLNEIPIYYYEKEA